MHLITLLSDEKLRKKVENDVHDSIEAGVVSVEKVEDCLNLFDLLPDIEAIAFDDIVAGELLEVCKKKEIFVDLIYLGEKELDSSGLTFHKVSLSQNIGAYLEESLSHECVSVEKDLEYYSILSSNINYFKEACVDVYIRIKKEEYNHYIKYLKQDEIIDKSQLEKVQSLKRVFIKNEDKEKFFQGINDVFLERLGKGKKESLTQDVRTEIFNELLDIGFSERSCKVARATVDDVMGSLNKSLLEDLKSLYQTEASFHFRKSFMTPVIALNLAKGFSWVTETNKEALVLSSLFNDRELSSEEMHFALSVESLEVSSLSDVDKDIVNKHAKNSADWIKEQKGLPIEVERIVRQHHGSPTGVGLYSELGPQITQLSMLFIVSEEFSNGILINDSNKVDAGKIIKDISKKYSNKKIDKILDVLIQSLSGKS